MNGSIMSSNRSIFTRLICLNLRQTKKMAPATTPINDKEPTTAPTMSGILEGDFAGYAGNDTLLVWLGVVPVLAGEVRSSPCVTPLHVHISSQHVIFASRAARGMLYLVSDMANPTLSRSNALSCPHSTRSGIGGPSHRGE